MLKVGLTGGYASGKSFVAAELERLGCHLIYADRIGHEVLKPQGEAFGPTIETFGEDILGPDGAIDRKRLGQIVFGSPKLLETLMGYVHPAVFRMEERMMEKLQLEDPRGIVVIEAAILIETGRYAIFDRLILTACDPELQVARAMRRDGITREEVLERIARQLPLEKARPYADFIVDTGGEKPDTIALVGRIHRELRKLAAADPS